MPEAQKTWLVEAPRVFSESRLWDLQRHYFVSRSLLAWQRGEVPQYVTTNVSVANSYAEIVFALLRDEDRLAPDAAPLHVCELGAGSGRFAFHFLSRLHALCTQHGVPVSRFRYILTDIVEDNLEFFRRHPRFKPYFESGMLDTAMFDVAASDALTLRGAGERIAAASLSRPLVVLANYLFDSVPQDFFHVHDGGCDRCLVSLSVDADPETLEGGELLSRLKYELRFEPCTGAVYEDGLQQVLDQYCRTLPDAHVSFPVAGLRCLDRLQRLSRRGVLLLSADKGYHRVGAAHETPRPRLARHGSFSVDVNYDAFARFCAGRGGLAFMPGTPHGNLSVSGFLITPDADAHVETRRAYRRHVEEFGPDDFFTIAKYVRRTKGEMSAAELLACLRLSHYDSTQCVRYLPRLITLAPNFSDDERAAVADAMERVWALHYPFGEETDVAFEIARVFYEMEDYRRAVRFFERSIETSGEHVGTLCNIAMCHQLLGDLLKAERLLRRVLASDPDNEDAKALLASTAG